MHPLLAFVVITHVPEFFSSKTPWQNSNQRTWAGACVRLCSCSLHAARLCSARAAAVAAAAAAAAAAEVGITASSIIQEARRRERAGLALEILVQQAAAGSLTSTSGRILPALVTTMGIPGAPAGRATTMRVRKWRPWWPRRLWFGWGQRAAATGFTARAWPARRPTTFVSETRALSAPTKSVPTVRCECVLCDASLALSRARSLSLTRTRARSHTRTLSLSLCQANTACRVRARPTRTALRARTGATGSNPLLLAWTSPRSAFALKTLLPVW